MSYIGMWDADMFRSVNQNSGILLRMSDGKTLRLSNYEITQLRTLGKALEIEESFKEKDIFVCKRIIYEKN